MKHIISLVVVGIIAAYPLSAQMAWTNVDAAFGRLPAGVHVYRTESLLNGRPNIAYYVEADLREPGLIFSADTSAGRRLTPVDFYSRTGAAIVVNCTFFSFATNQNLNTVILNGQMVGFNLHSLPGKGRDTLTYRHPIGSAIGVSADRRADVAWVFADSTEALPRAYQKPRPLVRDSSATFRPREPGKRWKMQTAVGGGPVLVQQSKVDISNNEEFKFAGKAIDDLHPRTAMGYTADNKLIILVIEGRNKGKAEGASLRDEADILVQIGCVEALNLDGGGSSCLLVNGKETIWPSDKGKQRPVPAVFTIREAGKP